MADSNNTGGAGWKTPLGIGPQSTITLGFAIVLAGLIFKFTSWQASVEQSISQNAKFIEGFEGTVDELRTAADDVTELRRRFEAANAHPAGNFAYWRRFSMEQWATKLGRDNPALVVPDVMKTPWLDHDRSVIVYP